jgi:hypothetical protein
MSGARPTAGTMLPMLAAVALGALVGLAPAAAFAHPLIDEAVQRYDDADLPGALEALARAERATNLTRADLVQLFLRRAMVHHAMHHQAEVEADVFRLAALERGLALRRVAPPPVRLAYEAAVARMAGSMRLDVEARRTPDGLELVARVIDDDAALVQAVHLRARAPGGEWQRSEDGSVELLLPSGAAVEYVAEAIGPGGAVLVAAGTESAPLTATATIAPDPGMAGAEGTAASGRVGPAGHVEETGLGPWPWIIAGGGVLVVAAVVLIAVLASSPSGDQHISGLMVTF